MNSDRSGAPGANERLGESVAPAAFTDGEATLIAQPIDSCHHPEKIGRFEIRSILGQGAFGKVYAAFDPQLGRDVAIKAPLPRTLRDEHDRARFEKEARAAARINHPNVCQIFEVGEFDGHPYIVMALVPGRTLAEVIKARQKPFSEIEAILIARKIAQAIAAAHQKGIVHRDLKPSNVMLDEQRRDVVVMDFGLACDWAWCDARDTASGQIVGTPAYMSPEQARGDSKEVGPASDVFSLGVILYELLTGQRPFKGTPTEIIAQILFVESPSPSTLRRSLSSQLERICQKALSKEPEKRFPSMHELLIELDAALAASRRSQDATGVDNSETEALAFDENAEIAAIVESLLRDRGESTATLAPRSLGNEAQRRLARMGELLRLTADELEQIGRTCWTSGGQAASYAQANWRESSKARELHQRMLAFGESLHRLHQGKQELRDEIDEVLRQIETLADERKPVKSLEERLRQLFLRLAKSELFEAGELGPLQGQADSLRAATQDVERLSNERRIKQSLFFSKSKTDLRRLGVGASLSCFCLLFLFAAIFWRPLSDDAPSSIAQGSALATIDPASFIWFHDDDEHATVLSYQFDNGGDEGAYWANRLNLETQSVESRVQLMSSKPIEQASFNMRLSLSSQAGSFLTLDPNQVDLTTIKVAPRGDWVALLSPYDGTLHVFDIFKGEKRFSKLAYVALDTNRTLNFADVFRVKPQLVISECGNYLATSHNDNATRLWDARTGSQVGKVIARWMNLVKFDFDQGVILEIDANGSFSDYEFRSGKSLPYSVVASLVYQLPRQKPQIVGVKDQEVVVVERGSARTICKLCSTESPTSGAVHGLYASPDGRWVALERGSLIETRDSRTGELLAQFEFTSPNPILDVFDRMFYGGLFVDAHDLWLMPKTNWACLSADGKKLAIGTFHDATRPEGEMVARVINARGETESEFIAAYDRWNFPTVNQTQLSQFVPFAPDAKRAISGIAYQFEESQMDLIRTLRVHKTESLRR